MRSSHEHVSDSPSVSSPARSLRPGLALPIAILAVSSASILIRFAQSEAPSLVIASLRIGIASMILAPMALTRYRSEITALSRSQAILALLSGLFLAAHFAAWISSLEYTTVASSVVFVSTGPLWVALVAPLMLKEQVSRHALYGLGIALLGGAVVGLAGTCRWEAGLSCTGTVVGLKGSALQGNFLALVGAWAVAGYLVIGRKLRAGMSLIPYIFLVYSMSAAVLLIFNLGMGQSLTGYQPITYFWILLLALLPQLIGHSTYNWALRYLPASSVATANLGEPIGSALLAYMILNEKPGILTILGGILILIGIFMTSRTSVIALEDKKRKMEIMLPSHNHLDQLAIPYQRRSFSPLTEKGAANVAHALGFPERQAIKTLIFHVDTGEKVLVMLGGDQSAISANLKRAIGSRNIQMAAPDVVKQTTGYIIGSIPPFGWQPPGFRTFLEASLVAEPMLGVGAGQWGEEIMLTPQDLIRACNAIVVNLTKREQPAKP